MLPPRSGPYAHLPRIGPPTTTEQIAEFRARVLWSAGRRPSFRRDDGVYVDHDALDEHAFHVALRDEGAIVGCIRTNPTSESPPSSMAAELGPALLAHVLGSLGVERHECWDGGRWAVDSDRQRSALGGELACAAMAVARHLGGRRLVGVAGMRQGQANRLVSLGAKYVEACPPIEARALDDELRVVAFDLDDVHPDAAARIASFAAELRPVWPSVERPSAATRPALHGPCASVTPV